MVSLCSASWTILNNIDQAVFMLWLVVLNKNILWLASCEKVPSDTSRLARLRAACASAWNDHPFSHVKRWLFRLNSHHFSLFSYTYVYVWTEWKMMTVQIEQSSFFTGFIYICICMNRVKNDDCSHWRVTIFHCFHIFFTVFIYYTYVQWRKYVHEVLVNRLGGLSLPRKSVVRLTDRPDMTLDVYRGHKTTVQQQPMYNVWKQWKMTVRNELFRLNSHHFLLFSYIIHMPDDLSTCVLGLCTWHRSLFTRHQSLHIWAVERENLSSRKCKLDMLSVQSMQNSSQSLIFWLPYKCIQMVMHA